MRFFKTVAVMVGFLAGPAQNSVLAADEPARPQDPMWQNAVCGNPTLPRSVIKKRQAGHVTALYDIDADGNVTNIRVVESVPNGKMDYSVKRALQRWRYFLYFEKGIAAPRPDMTVTFTYGENTVENSCTHTSLPERASTAGDPFDPYTQLKTCFTLVMPRASAREKQSGQVDLAYDITADGDVENTRVVAADPPGVFDKAALTSLNRWDYYQFKKAGEAAARPDMAVSFFFGTLPGGATDHRCGYAPFDAIHTITKVEPEKERKKNTGLEGKVH